MFQVFILLKFIQIRQPFGKIMLKKSLLPIFYFIHYNKKLELLGNNNANIQLFQWLNLSSGKENALFTYRI